MKKLLVLISTLFLFSTAHAQTWYGDWRVAGTSVAKEWDSAFLYEEGDLCSYGSSVFISLQDSNTNHATSDGSWWEEVGGGSSVITDLTANNWRLFYSNGLGDVTELALGANGTYLQSNGAGAIPSFSTPSGSGDVSKVGTPVNNQIGIWTGDGTIEGDADLTFDGDNLTVDGSVSATSLVVTGLANHGLTLTNNTSAPTLDNNTLAVISNVLAFEDSTGTQYEVFTEGNRPTIALSDMSANSVDSDQYVDASIDTAHIADSQITNTLMADNSVDSAEYVDGSIDIEHLSAAAVAAVPANKTAAYTIGTDNAKECYGGVVYVTSAAVITACDALASGMNFTVVTIGAIAVSLDTQTDDLMYLDGIALDDGDRATNTSTTGDIITCTYYNATGWYCASGSPDGDHWTDGGA